MKHSIATNISDSLNAIIDSVISSNTVSAGGIGSIESIGSIGSSVGSWHTANYPYSSLASGISIYSSPPIEFTPTEDTEPSTEALKRMIQVGKK